MDICEIIKKLSKFCFFNCGIQNLLYFLRFSKKSKNFLNFDFCFQFRVFLNFCPKVWFLTKKDYFLNIEIIQILNCVAQTVADANPDVRFWARRSLNYLNQKDDFLQICEKHLSNKDIAKFGEIIQQNQKSFQNPKPKSAVVKGQTPRVQRRSHSLRVNNPILYYCLYKLFFIGLKI